MAQDIKPMQESVRLNATVGQGNYTQAFGAMALTPDMYGQLGSSVAMTASMELNKRRGIQAGLNPSGDVLPPLTKADEAYNNAYQNQAHATLSNQAQQVFYQADEAISKLNKISPDDISQYKQTVQQSLEQILEVAPNDAKTSLFNGFNNQLVSSVHNYQNRYLSQQKAEQRSNFELALSTAQQNIHESFMNGGAEKANEALNSQIQLIDQGVSGGIFSKAQGEAAKKSAGINYQTNALIQQGIVAQAEGKSAEWAQSLVKPESKPDGINWSDWETASNNAVRYMANRESFSRQVAQVVASNGYLEIANQEMTPEKLLNYKEQLREEPVIYNNLAIAYAHQNNKTVRAETELSQVAANWQNAREMGNASPGNIDKAYTQLSKLYQDQQKAMGNPVTPEEADFITAASAAVPVSRYNNNLASGMMSGDPGRMQRAINYYHRLDALPGNKTAPFLNKTDAIAMMNNFEAALSSGKTEEEAAAIAQDILNRSKTDKEYASRINNITTSFLNENANTSEKGYQWVRKQIDIPSNVAIEDHGALVSAWRKQFTQAMQLTDGNTETANKMAKQSFDKTFGVTKVNGHKSYMQYPPEKFVSGGQDAIPLIQMDMHAQLVDSVEYNKKIYDSGHQNYYYEIEPATKLDEYTQAKERIRTKGLSDPKYATDKQLISKVESGQPLKVTRVYRNGQRQEWQTYLKNNPFQSMSLTTGELIGSYDVGLYDPKTGNKDSFYGVFPNGAQKVDYYPSRQWINDNFFKVQNITPPDLATEREKREYYISHSDEIKYNKSLSKFINKAGRSFR